MIIIITLLISEVNKTKEMKSNKKSISYSKSDELQCGWYQETVYSVCG